MRKVIAIAAMLVFVFAVSSGYACGDKESAAKASKASYDGSCGSKATKVEKAAVENDKAKVMTADYKVETADAKAHCTGKSAAAKASVMKVDATGGCCHGAKAAKASVKTADAKLLKANCPATKDCPVPCNKETKLDNMKAEKEAPVGDTQASISEVSSPNE
jgi:hypothetical protein